VVCATENPVRVYDWERGEMVDEILLMSGCLVPDRVQLRELVEGHRQADREPQHVQAEEADVVAGVGEHLEAQHGDRGTRRGHVVVEDEHLGKVRDGGPTDAVLPPPLRTREPHVPSSGHLR
jgi:hypothetical protein